MNQFEAPYVNVKSGRMSTTTFFRGEPVLYHADHKSGRSLFFVYLESLTPFRFPPAVLPCSIRQQKRCAPSPCSYPHHEDRRRCPWETTLATVSPFLLPISPGRANSGGVGECPQNSFRDAFRGVVHSPGYFVTGDRRIGRMMPWRFAQTWLTKLSLPDIEQACSGDDLPMGERLLWKRSAPPF